MNTLRLKNINLHAPYRVWQKLDSPFDYYFLNDHGLEFNVSIQPGYSIVPSGAYEFGINNPHHRSSHGDLKLRKTIFAIIEEFFDANGNDVLLYMTETGDGKQAFRNRLFIRWFNTYENRSRYFITTAEGQLEGQDNFMALIARAENPRLQDIVAEFTETIELLFDT